MVIRVKTVVVSETDRLIPVNFDSDSRYSHRPQIGDEGRIRDPEKVTSGNFLRYQYCTVGIPTGTCTVHVAEHF